MLHLTISLRALVFVLLLGIISSTGSDVARGAPSQADGNFDTLNVNGNIIFSGPGVDGARDIRTTNNDGGLRFYNGNGPLTNPPDGAAIQFFGNDRNVFNGQAYIDSGAHNNAAIIFRTAGTSQAVAERMRITAGGNVGIGTTAPAEKFTVQTGSSMYGVVHTDGTTTVGTYVDGSGGWLGTKSSHPLHFFTENGNAQMTVTTSGNVGIGTQLPNEQLELTGNLRLPATTSTTGIIRSGSNTLLHTFGISNFFAGVGAGNLTMTGSFNTATGYEALLGNTEGIQNTANGRAALLTNTTGSGNTATGSQALINNTTGSNNTATGITALQFNTTGGGNTATGQFALQNNTTGANNVAVGASAGGTNATGSSNTFIGAGADAGMNNFTKATAIGANAVVNQSNSLVLGGTGADAVSVGIGTTIPLDKLHVIGDIRIGTSGANGCLKSASGGLIIGTCASDARLKRDIQALNPVLARLAALQPSSFLWRAEEFPERHFGSDRNYGLIAQEVEAVMPELVATDEQGMKSVHYELLPILLLEGVKELKAENDALTADNGTLHEQVSSLQQQNVTLAEQNAGLEARLAAIEQRLNGSNLPLVAAR